VSVCDPIPLSVCYVVPECSDGVEKCVRCMFVASEGKGGGHSLDIVLLSQETSLQRCSGMADIVEGFHCFTCTSRTIPALAFPARASSFTDPRGMEG